MKNSQILVNKEGNQVIFLSQIIIKPNDDEFDIKPPLKNALAIISRSI